MLAPGIRRAVSTTVRTSASPSADQLPDRSYRSETGYVPHARALRHQVVTSPDVPCGPSMAASTMSGMSCRVAEDAEPARSPFMVRMLTWCVSRSSSAPVRRSDARTCVQSSNGRLDVTMVDAALSAFAGDLLIFTQHGGQLELLDMVREENLGRAAHGADGQRSSAAYGWMRTCLHRPRNERRARWDDPRRKAWRCRSSRPCCPTRQHVGQPVARQALR